MLDEPTPEGGKEQRGDELGPTEIAEALMRCSKTLEHTAYQLAVSADVKVVAKLIQVSAELEDIAMVLQRPRRG